MSQKVYLHEDKTLKFLDRNLWLRLGKMLKGHIPLLTLALITVFISQLLPQYFPKILMGVVDGPIKNRDLEGIYPYVLKFISLIAITGLLQYVSSIAGQLTALKIIHQFRLDLFKQLQTYQLDFFKRTPVGRLMTRLTNDVDSLNAMFAEGFIDLISAGLMLIFPVFFIFQLNWKMALVSLAVTPLMLISTSLFRTKVREINILIRKSIAELNTKIQENLSGNYIVQIFGKSQDKFREFDAINHKLKEQWEKNVLYFSRYFPAINSLTEISLIMMYFVGAYLFLKDEVSLGTIMAFSWYMGMFWRPLREISDKYTMLQSALAAAERVFTLFDIKATLPNGNKGLSTGSPLTLRFEEVYFQYEPGEDILKNINCEFREGETVAIVGATGSGKSTMLSLANYFYPPTQGQVLLNDEPLQNYKLAELSSLIGFIPQDVYLFAQSVAFNIALSDDINQEKMKEVCSYVNADSFIEKLPQGYETVLKERGENLSTGQRQLLAFARALYQDSRFLLLDEATSSIDTQTEQLIQDALDKLTHRLTCIIVAHRLSTIKNASKILVMHKGEIRESGTHKELMEKNGIYQKLYELQA